MKDWWNTAFDEVMKYYREPWELDEECLQFLCSELSLDERYMREFRNYLQWGSLCQHQKMSMNFIIEMDQLGKIKWWNLAMNDKIQLNEKIIERHLDNMCSFNLLSWDTPIVKLFAEKDFSDEFIRRNYCYINWGAPFTITYLKNDKERCFEKYKKVLTELGINYGKH